MYPTGYLLQLPLCLAPKSVVEFPVRPLYSIGGGGLYGTSELRAAHKSFLDSQERGAISNIIGRRMQGKSVMNQGYSVPNLLSSAEWETMAKKAAGKLWVWLQAVGSTTSGFFGVYMIFCFFKYGVNVVLNAYSIYQISGLGVSLFAALWNSMTMCLVHKHLHAKGEEVKSHLASVVPLANPSCPEAPSGENRCEEHMYPLIKDGFDKARLV